MKSVIKSQVRSNPFFYRIWLFIKQKGQKQLLKLRLPQVGDDFYIDGYPRSGNTFCTGYLKWIIPQKKYAHHLHNIAPIKIALLKNIKTIILYRNPKDTIASYAIMQDYYGQGLKSNKDYLYEILQNYIFYYQFVLNEKNRITVLNFETIIDIHKLHNFFNKKLSVQKKNRDELEGFVTRFKDNQKRKPSQRTNAPNEERQKMKIQVEQIIEELPNFSIAMKVFNELNSIK